jgi:hypothetical protein
MNKHPVNNQIKVRYLILPLFIGLVIGLLALEFFVSKIDNTKKLDELALGEATSIYLAIENGVPIHCHDLEDAFSCLEPYNKNSGDEGVVLWLGNSQIHSINQMNDGDETAASTLHRQLQIQSRYLLSFSQPNASLQEHYVLFEYLLNKLPISTLILPLVFDDMRETGIRQSLSIAFEEKKLKQQLETTGIGRLLLSNHGSHDSSGNDMEGLEDTVQEMSEVYLNSELESIWDVWANRKELRGHLLTSLYFFRNWVFGINASTTRKMIPGRYSINKQSLEAIVDSARDSNISVLIYIAPLRNDVKIPYDLQQYNDFKAEILSIKREGVRVVDFENLVPGKYWGSKASTTVEDGQEVDFMHFQAGGHRLLTAGLLTELRLLWKERGLQ